MKKLFLLLFLSLAAFVVSPQAQIYSVIQLDPGVNNVLLSTSSNAVTTALCDVRKQKDFVVGLQYKLDSASTTGAVQVWLQPSLDGSAFETATNNDAVLAVTPAGTATVYGSANFHTYGMGFWKIRKIVCDNGNGNATNIVVKYVIKTGAP
jgi:hypothetical protein